MTGSLRVSEKFGLNPTLGVCFWCGKETGVIALLGHNRGKEAARHTVLSYTPCDPCKEKMGKGITLIEVVPESLAKNPPMADGYSPTGRWVVIREEAAKEVFDEKVCADLMRAKSGFIPPEVANMLGVFDKEVPGAEG